MMTNSSANRRFLLLNNLRTNHYQIQNDRHVPIAYDSNNEEEENNIDQISMLTGNKEHYDQLHDILFHMTGYSVKFLKDFYENEVILKSILANSFHSGKNRKDQECKTNIIPTITLSSVIHCFQSFFSNINDEAYLSLLGFDDLDRYKSSMEQNIPKENSNNELFISAIVYILNHEELYFQNAVKAIIILIYLSKDLSIMDNIKQSFQFQNKEIRERFLFIELVALSDIFFTNKSMNRKLFSQYENTCLFPNLIDFQGKSHQFFASYDYDNERLLAKSNNQDFNFEIPINFIDGTLNSILQTIDFNDRKRCTFTYEKKERGSCSGLIINFFYDEVFVRRLYCKELYCSSEQYPKMYQIRLDIVKQTVRTKKGPISVNEYSKLANICSQIPPYSEYVELQYENFVTQFVYHFNAHVELFGYYLLRNLEICPEFTVYRSEFDSKTYIIMESLNDCYYFCRDIDPTTLCNTTINGLCHSTIKLHYMRAIHQVFFLSDFHESNVALKIEGDNVEDINIIDLWPSYCPLEINVISDYESLKRTMNGQTNQVAVDETIVSDELYTKLNSLDEQVLLGDPIVYDIMLTKKWRFKMLTYHTYNVMFRN